MSIDVDFPARDRLGTGAITERALLGAGTLVALVATGGSLYLSLGIGLVPCELCWYQRILMYPLVVVLGVAFLEGRATVYRAAFPLAGIGLAVAGYHSYLQATADATRCTVGSCAAVLLSLGGLTIPNLSFVAFALIAALLALVLGHQRAA